MEGRPLDQQAEFREMRRFIANNAAASALLDASSEVLGTRRNLAVLLTIAFLAGLTGPFGTSLSFETWGRFLYWAFIVFGTVLPVHLVLTAFERRSRWSGWRDTAWMTLAGLAAAIPATLVVYAVAVAFGSRIGALAVFDLYLQCALVVVAIAGLVRLVSGVSGTGSQNPTEARILDRLPGACRGRLIRLAAQDHYVEVVTDRGQFLVAMRLRDAIAEAAPVAGAQVHRSHWVAKDAVIGRRTVGRILHLQLADGSTVPIGRTFREKAKFAGVLF